METIIYVCLYIYTWKCFSTIWNFFDVSSHKSAEAALSGAHSSQAENVPEYSHSDRGHPQSIDGTVDT